MRYQSNRPKRQFLAGVKCSQCGALDSTVQVQIFQPAFDEHIECTLCGHYEKRPSAKDLKNSAKVTDEPAGTVGIVKFFQ